MNFNRVEKTKYQELPINPGVYRFYNTNDDIIYVGKAKNLRKRVSSYFTKSNHDNRKTHYLVSEIAHIETIIVSTEFDALLLENNLIKEHQPKYNILLKDDKSFPSIIVTNERFPRVYSTRRIIKNQGQYFGPYSNVKALNSVLDLIRKLYTIRTCKLNLSEQNVKSRKFKVCLEYHLGNCLGPCEDFQSEKAYQEEINQAILILKGKTSIVKQTFIEKMNFASQELKFEIALTYKNKIDLLEKFQSKSLIISHNINDADVFSMKESENHTYVINYLKIENGYIIDSETIEIKNKVNNAEEILEFSMFELKQKFNSKSTLILSNISIESLGGIEVVVPKIGDKKKLVELSIKNILFYIKQKVSYKEGKNSNLDVLEELKNDLQLQKIPLHIECFDNSNIQGTNPVASMVCFKKGIPSKKDYRKFNIKSVKGPDDFKSMHEVVFRRYNYLLKEKEQLPDLIVIDGGKGQLNAACHALKELMIYGKIPIIGIAKRLEEIYYPDDELPLHISKKSQSLKLVQKIRDEAHRFAITFHRQKRSSNSYLSSLDKINGIGPETRNKLFEKFKSKKGIISAKPNELFDAIGKSKGKIIIESIKKGLL